MKTPERPDYTPRLRRRDSVVPVVAGTVLAFLLTHSPFTPAVDELLGIAPAAAAAPALPHGRPNFDPDITYASVSGLEVQLTDTPRETRQAGSAVIESGSYYGYATEHTVNGQPGIELQAGARIVIKADGSVAVDNLYGPPETTITPAQLGRGPTSTSLGGGYTITVGLDPASGEPEVSWEPSDQQPPIDTFIGQQNAA